jgi:hypothetical protein
MRNSAKRLRIVRAWCAAALWGLTPGGGSARAEVQDTWIFPEQPAAVTLPETTGSWNGAAVSAEFAPPEELATPEAPAVPYVEPAPAEETFGNPVVLEPPDSTGSVDSTCPAADPLDLRFSYQGSGVPRPTSWIVGSSDRLGIFSLSALDGNIVSLGRQDVLGNLVIHFVSGPDQTDLPPQLFDVGIGLRRRAVLFGERLAVDLSARPGLYTDFKVSLQEAWRCPAHGVLYYQATEFLQWVLGVDFPHRDDLTVLPVAGVVLRPMPELRLDVVFPQPRVVLRWNEKRTAYVAADFTGDMWAIERAFFEEDVATYRDFRLVLGVQSADCAGPTTYTEIGYVFDRRLEYRSGVGDYKPLDTVIWRTVTLY